MTEIKRDSIDRRLIAVLSEGLPLVARPYRAIAADLGVSEQEMIERITALQSEGALKRFGVIVRHKEIGYRANAMVVWDIPDDDLASLGKTLADEPCVTLCYRRPRREGWPYSLFTMIHGLSRAETLGKLEAMIERQGLHDIPHDVLFSTRRFKQNGARYGDQSTSTKEARAS